MKKVSILSIFSLVMLLFVFSISASAVEGIIIGPEGLPLEGFSNVYVIDGKAEPVYNFAEHRWYDVFVVGTDENGTPICHVVPSSRTSNEAGRDKGSIEKKPMCFAGDTLVMMADGSTRMIKDITVGEKVMGYDFEAGRFTSSEVLSNESATIDDYYILNGGLKVTGRHPFYAKNVGITLASTGPRPVTTIETQTLKPYATLYGFSTTGGPAIKKITLKSIEHVNEGGTVYDLQVDGTRNFFVSPDGRFFVAVTVKNL
jgi:hypothetical protein